MKVAEKNRITLAQYAPIFLLLLGQIGCYLKTWLFIMEICHVPFKPYFDLMLQGRKSYVFIYILL